VSHVHGSQLRCELALPEWVESFLAAWAEPLDEEDRRMRLAIALAEENVRRQTGGPFGAIVVEEGSGRLLGAGVNRVTALGLSLAHAEMLALSLAQRERGDWNLGCRGAVQLVTARARKTQKRPASTKATSRRTGSKRSKRAGSGRAATCCAARPLPSWRAMPGTTAPSIIPAPERIPTEAA
jgi:hypothetical protein